MSKNIWTQDDVDTLKKMYADGCDLKTISNKLNRTTHAISNKAQRLGIVSGVIKKTDTKYKAVYQNYDWCYERYINLSMTHEQMAQEAGCSLRVMQKWCSEKYGLNARTFKEYKKLSNIQKQLIIFSLLGDGHIDKRENAPLFIVSHAENQKDYLFWKYHILEDLCANEPTHYPEGIVNFGNDKIYKRSASYRFGTRIINDLIPIREMSKTEIIEQLNEFGIAIHILDDAYRSNSNWYVCVAAFTPEEKVLYVDVCKSNLKLNCKIMKDDRYIEFDAISSRRIDDIILSEIPNDLDVVKYKITDKDICEPANYFYVITDNEKIGLRRYCDIKKLPYIQVKKATNDLQATEIQEDELITILKENGVINNEGVRKLSQA